MACALFTSLSGKPSYSWNISVFILFIYLRASHCSSVLSLLSVNALFFAAGFLNCGSHQQQWKTVRWSGTADNCGWHAGLVSIDLRWATSKVLECILCMSFSEGMTVYLIIGLIFLYNSVAYLLSFDCQVLCSVYILRDNGQQQINQHTVVVGYAACHAIVYILSVNIAVSSANGS